MISRIALALTLAIVTAAVPAQAKAATYRPLVIAHRGGLEGSVPEGTLAAYDHAWRNGADVLEGDIRWTLDNQMVILHDATVDRVTDCTGAVAEMTLAQVKACDMGSGTEIPTAAELVAFGAANGIPLNLEVKPGAISADQAKQVTDLIVGIGHQRKTRIASFGTATLRAIQARKITGLTTAHLTFTNSTLSPEAQRTRSSGYMPEMSTITKAHVTALHAVGVKVYPFTADTPEDWERLYVAGVDGIVTNYPSALATWLDAR